jgi:glycosyltransferase involved in cell wall biosynthesis
MLNRRQLAHLFNQIDIFADLTLDRGHGLLAASAMACGAAVITPNVSTGRIGRDGENCVVVEAASVPSYVNALEVLISEESRRSQIQRQAIVDSCAHTPELAAFKSLGGLFKDVARDDQ